MPLPADGPDLPESRFIVAETLVRFDHAGGVAEVLAGRRRGAARPVRRRRRRRSRRDGAQAERRRAALPDRPTTSATWPTAKEHIVAGDIFQVVLSQRAERPTSAGALQLYRTLRRVNPSPYLFLLELGDLALIGSSPETLVKLEGDAGEPEPDRRHDGARRRATPSGCSPRRRTAPST